MEFADFTLYSWFHSDVYEVVFKVTLCTSKSDKTSAQNHMNVVFDIFM